MIIPSKDRKAILQENLRRLADVAGLQDLEVLIVNDSIHPLQLDISFPFATIYSNEFGAGVASARNFGASKARHDWLVFMDDDMLVLPDTFSKLTSLIRGKEESCFNINWIYPKELVELRKKLPFLRYLQHYKFDSLEGWSNDPNWRANETFKVNGITSQFLVMHKSVFQRVGGYNPSFPFAGFEDYDLSERLRHAGVDIYVDPLNIIFHNEEDRITVENWLERKKRGAITQKVAVSMGYKGVALRFSKLKSVVNEAIYRSRRQWLFLLKNWPNARYLDSAYFIIVNRLFAAYVYAGYQQKSLHKA